MANRLIWSDRALEEYDKLQEYLYEEWGEEIAQRVIKEIAQTVFRIQNSPEHFPVFFKSRKIRRCVASPQTSIFLMSIVILLKLCQFLITDKTLINVNCKHPLFNFSKEIRFPTLKYSKFTLSRIELYSYTRRCICKLISINSFQYQLGLTGSLRN